MMTAPDDTHDGARATIREVMALVEAARRETLAEIEKLAAKVDAKLDAHAAKHEAEQQTHEVDHRREGDRRAGLMRWAVTTLTAVIGVVVALYVAFTRGSG